MGRVIRYVSQEKKTMAETGRRYLSGVNCTPELAQKSFMATKNLYGKADGIFFYHVISPPRGTISSSISFNINFSFSLKKGRPVFPAGSYLSFPVSNCKQTVVSRLYQYICTHIFRPGVASLRCEEYDFGCPAFSRSCPCSFHTKRALP